MTGEPTLPASLPPPAAADVPPGGAIPRPRFARPAELITIAVIVVLDQITKALVRANLPLGDSRTIIPGFLDLAHVQNTGAARNAMNQPTSCNI